MSNTVINKIWERIKSLAKLPKLLARRDGGREEPEPAPGLLTDLDKQLGRKIQQRHEKAGRPVDTSKHEHNMPKYQPCPKGHGMKKIRGKAIVVGVPGALYYCNQCKTEFFVRR